MHTVKGNSSFESVLNYIFDLVHVIEVIHPSKSGSSSIVSNTYDMSKCFKVR